ncbi:MAG: hypothetical protein ACIAQZ_16610 [Sedimentisphaeraceae bacterium JB056]
MRLNFVVIFVVLSVICIGCERQYSILTEEGIVDMPLSKALKTANSPQQLYPMLSEAADLEDREKIEKKIEELQGVELSNEPRDYCDRDDYIAEQSQRRIKYVKKHFLDDEMKETILSGNVVIGMTKEEFIASHGEPTEKKIVDTDQGKAEVFIEGMFDKCSYYFIDGKLAYWF